MGMGILGAWGGPCTPSGVMLRWKQLHGCAAFPFAAQCEVFQFFFLVCKYARRTLTSLQPFRTMSTARAATYDDVNRLAKGDTPQVGVGAGALIRHIPPHSQAATTLDHAHQQARHSDTFARVADQLRRAGRSINAWSEEVHNVSQRALRNASHWCERLSTSTTPHTFVSSTSKLRAWLHANRQRVLATVLLLPLAWLLTSRIAPSVRDTNVASMSNCATYRLHSLASG